MRREAGIVDRCVRAARTISLSRAPVVLPILAVSGGLAIACAPEPRDDARVPAVAAEEPRLPDELTDPSRAPDSDVFLPQLDGYEVDDAAEPGELQSSLDHGSVRYSEVRRRIVLDRQGFAAGEVTVVTVPPGASGVGRVLSHRFGTAERSSVRVAGVDMEWLEARPHRVLAWSGPTFVVTFERGQGHDEQWLLDLARTTVRGMADRS